MLNCMYVLNIQLTLPSLQTQLFELPSTGIMKWRQSVEEKLLLLGLKNSDFSI